MFYKSFAITRSTMQEFWYYVPKANEVHLTSLSSDTKTMDISEADNLQTLYRKVLEHNL